MLIHTRALSLGLTLTCGLPGAPAYTIATVAGSDWVGDGGAAAQALLMQAEGVAIDANGNVYVTDALNHRVRQISPAGIIRTIAGTSIRGYSGDGGPAVDAQLNSPYGIALDYSGRVYISDLGNGRVRRIGTDGTIRTIAAAPLISPRNLAIDGAGSVYVSDFDGHRVYQIGPDGLLSVVAGTGVSGFSGDSGAASQARLAFPAGLGVDRRNSAVYIGDTGNHAVRKMSGGVITTVSRISTPTGMTVDGLGTLFVADPAGGVVYRIPPTGDPRTIPVMARDVALGPDGSLYVTDANFVRRVLPSGIVSVVAGGGNPAFGDGGSAVSARLNHPSGVAVDTSGNVYVADRGNGLIRMLSATGTIATIASFDQPSSVSVDAAGNLYLADSGSRRVRMMTPQGRLSDIAGAALPVCALASPDGSVYIADAGAQRILRVLNGTAYIVEEGVRDPGGMALDRAGNLYFTDAARVRKLPPSGPASDIVPGAWKAPRGIAVDDAGNLYVADALRHQVILVDPRGLALPIAGTGTHGFSGDGDAAALAQLDSPSGIALGPGGKLYVADLQNNRIRVLSPATVAPPSPVLLADAVNAANFTAGPIAPGMLVAIRGSGIAPPDIPETGFLFAGLPALFFAIDNRAAFVQAPAELPLGSFSLVVRHRGLTRVSIPAVAASAAPGLFAAITNQDGSLNSAENPAGSGTIVAIYGTGFGSSGLPISVRIGGQSAELLYAGPMDGYPGVVQINAKVPPLAVGPQSLAAGAGGALSPAITVWTR
jgi:uncharacterized protein (TIGR03437 family)